MRAALYLVAMLVGCGSPGQGDEAGIAIEGPGNDGHDQLIAPLDGMETQGTHLLGTLLDAVGNEPGYHPNMLGSAVTADGQAVTVQFDGSAALRSGDHRGADPFFNGMTLTGSGGAKVRLTVSRGGYDVAFYKLETLTPTGWTNLCDHDGDDAVPLAGKWQRLGFHETAADRFSFACTGSVAFKCLVWGYLPGSDSTSLGWRAHQACTRMARGDYCANGHSHTREGTTITIYDFAGVTSPPPLRFDGVVDWPPNPTRMFFEAAWTDGAHPASCLSRLRWQSLPTGTLCDDGELRDPRLDTGVRFCEDVEWPPPGSDPTSALLFNASRYTDMALHVWRRGDDLVSTVRGFYQLPNVIQPFPNVGPYEHVRTDGIVLRSLFSGQDRASFEDLWMYRNASDFVVAGASRPPPGFTQGQFEGYAAKQQGAGMVPLNLYIKQDTGDYLSTTGTPDAAYVLQWTIGYVVPPETR